ncbi:MAG: HDOD domain-containing protein [Deltaproteobacteria bacterium]|nr:HDOD domain-containing protein [Deltaproteobacteria bacterium]
MSETKRNLDGLIEKIEEIPTIPVVSQKVMELSGDEEARFEDFVEIIEKDQALAARILRVANSAFYGFLSRISSLEHALVILGIDEVRSIVLGCSVYNFFSQSESDAFERTGFWKHAIICSQVARLLGTHFNIRNNGSFFLGGLIHDIGKVVLDQYFHEDFLKIIGHVSLTKTTFSKAEKKILGTTHYQIGAKLLKQWRFPDEVVTQILYHHAPWRDENPGPNSSMIYLANVLTKLAGYPCHPDEQQIDLHEFANSSELDFIIKKGFDLDYETIKNLISDIQEFALAEADNVMKLFN